AEIALHQLPQKEITRRKVKLEAYELAWRLIDHYNNAYLSRTKEYAWGIVRKMNPAPPQGMNKRDARIHRIRDATLQDTKGLNLGGISQREAEEIIEIARKTFSIPPEERI
ncbi:MAG: hypothetical protein WCW13_04165, partial [archaeon]